MVIDRGWSFYRLVERIHLQFLYTHLLWVSTLTQLTSLPFFFLDVKDVLNKIFFTGWFGIFPPPILTWIVPLNTYGDRNQWRHVLSCMYVNMLGRENNSRVFHLHPSFFMLFFSLLKRPWYSRTYEWLISKQRIFWLLCIFLVYRSYQLPLCPLISLCI